MKKLLWVLILLLLPLTALAEDAESRRDGAFFYQIADGEAILTGCDWDAMQADSLYMFAEPPVSLEIPATRRVFSFKERSESSPAPHHIASDFGNCLISCYDCKSFSLSKFFIYIDNYPFWT